MMRGSILKFSFTTAGRKARLVTEEGIVDLVKRAGAKFSDSLVALRKGLAYFVVDSEHDFALLQQNVDKKPIPEWKSFVLHLYSVDENVVSRAYSIFQQSSGRDFLDIVMEEDRKNATVAPSNVVSGVVPCVPGLTVIYDYISEVEESELWSTINGTPWVPQLSRLVQHYGVGFDYRTRTIAGVIEKNGISSGNAADEVKVGEAPVDEAGAIAGRTDPKALRPRTLPFSVSPHMLKTAASMSEYGFVGDGGWSIWNSFSSNRPIKGRAELDSLVNSLLMKGFVGNEENPGSLSEQHVDEVRSFITDFMSNQQRPAPQIGTYVGSTRTPDASFHRPVFPATDQATVNNYTPGRGISAHIDTHSGFEDGIISLSLGATTVMEFCKTADIRLSNGCYGLSSVDSSDVQEPSILRPEVFCNGESNVSHSTYPLGTKFQVVLPPRSLIVLRGEARYAWTHYIAPRKTDTINGVREERGERISATFRRARREPCKCCFPLVCFDQDGGSAEPSQLYSPQLQKQREVAATGQLLKEDRVVQKSSSLKSPKEQCTVAEDTHSKKLNERTESRDDINDDKSVTITPEIETQHVHKLYDSIAPHFSDTRHSTWPRVESYLAALPMGSIVTDIGCGNGKYLSAYGGKKNTIRIGTDRSAELVKICGQRNLEASVGDALHAPFRSGSADVAMSIAVLHHISTRPRRVQLLAELIRVLRRGGQGLVYCWALEQRKVSKRAFSAQDVMVPWRLPKEKVHHFASSLNSSEKAMKGLQEEDTSDQVGVEDIQKDISSAGGELSSDGSAIFQRYCHVYAQGELSGLLADAAVLLGGTFDANGCEVEEDGLPPGWGDFTGKPTNVVPAGRRGDSGVFAEEVGIKDAEIEPVRTVCNSVSKKTKFTSEDSDNPDLITLKLQQFSSKLETTPVPPIEDSSPFTVKILMEWWERDNWCILFEKS